MDCSTSPSKMVLLTINFAVFCYAVTMAWTEHLIFPSLQNIEIVLKQFLPQFWFTSKKNSWLSIAVQFQAKISAWGGYLWLLVAEKTMCPRYLAQGRIYNRTYLFLEIRFTALVALLSPVATPEALRLGCRMKYLNKCETHFHIPWTLRAMNPLVLGVSNVRRTIAKCNFNSAVLFVHQMPWSSMNHVWDQWL